MSSLAISDSVTVERLYGEAEAGDFLALLKPRVMSLVVFTAAVGLLLAPGSIGWVLGAVSILAIAVGAGASGALNMWYDSDIDAVMSRTRTRPIPSGRVGREEALIFGMVLSVLSVMVLGLAANWAAAGLLAFTIFFYAVVYTMWLKRTTPQNIVIGGAAGAFPPMVGWAAATGGVGLESVLLFLVIFLWTPPHFWALALFKENDYERAGIPMMPNVAGGASTRRQILAYSVALAVTGLLPAAFGFSGILYAVVAAALGGFFLYRAVQVWRNAGADPLLLAEKRLFGFSLIYLFAIFAALLVDRLAVSWLTAAWL